MDYEKWGAEYLVEAETLKRREEDASRSLTKAEGEQAAQLEWRRALLHEMYLECMHIGRELQQRGKEFARENKKVEF